MTKRKAKKNYVKKDIYQDVTDRIIEALENGTAPWVKPWTGQTGCSDLPYSAITGNNYRGINVLLLWSEQMKNGYQSNTWLTFKQANDLGGNVKKGQKSTSCNFYKMIDIKDKATGEDDKIPMLKGFSLFNIEQCENIDHDKLNIPAPVITNYNDSLEFALNCGASVNHGGDRAFFSPGHDQIQMPAQNSFNSIEEYEGTLLHELTHWTGHKSRLDRIKGSRFGDTDYAFEELIAEMGSAFLCANLGVKHEELQHPSYIKSWLKALKNDKRLIFKAASQAEKASRYLLDIHCEQALAA